MPPGRAANQPRDVLSDHANQGKVSYWAIPCGVRICGQRGVSSFRPAHQPKSTACSEGLEAVCKGGYFCHWTGTYANMTTLCIVMHQVRSSCSYLMEAKEKPSLAHIDDIDSLPSAPRKCCTPPEAPTHKVRKVSRTLSTCKHRLSK